MKCQQNRIELVTRPGEHTFFSGGHSRDITVDSELPSLPTDGVRLSSAAVSSSLEHQPVSLSDIDLTMVKPEDNNDQEDAGT